MASATRAPLAVDPVLVALQYVTLQRSMSIPTASDLATQHTLGDAPVPEAVRRLAASSTPEFVWRNELGGLTFRVGARYVKWNPLGNDIDLHAECERLVWICERHPAPHVLDYGEDDAGQWFVTEALAGSSAVGETWRARPGDAIRAIAIGLRALHSISTADFPERWSRTSWLRQAPATIGPQPEVVDPVLVHGDACAPNTLVAPDGAWVGNVDFGALAVGDRWADLAVASMSLGWNFGEGHEDEFFDAYGIEPDTARIRYYRALWDLAS